MDRVAFKKEFKDDLEIAKKLADRYLSQGYTVDQVIDILVRWAPAHFGSLSFVEEHAVEKVCYIATFARQIIKGNFDEEEIDALCDEIEEKDRIRVA